MEKRQFLQERKSALVAVLAVSTTLGFFTEAKAETFSFSQKRCEELVKIRNFFTSDRIREEDFTNQSPWFKGSADALTQLNYEISTIVQDEAKRKDKSAPSPHAAYIKALSECIKSAPQVSLIDPQAAAEKMARELKCRKEKDPRNVRVTGSDLTVFLGMAQVTKNIKNVEYRCGRRSGTESWSHGGSCELPHAYQF